MGVYSWVRIINGKVKTPTKGKRENCEHDSWDGGRERESTKERGH